MVAEVAVSRPEVTQRVTLSLTRAHSCTHLSFCLCSNPSISWASCLSVHSNPTPNPPKLKDWKGVGTHTVYLERSQKELFLVLFLTHKLNTVCNENPTTRSYWDLKHEEHVPPLSFSNWGVMVSGTSDWSMSFSLAMMCFTKQLAASSMFMFSWKQRVEKKKRGGGGDRGEGGKKDKEYEKVEDQSML